MTDLNAIKKKLFNDKELRKKICEQHQIIRYVLDGLGFEFPLDEEIMVQDPENTQVWNEFETQFSRANESLKK